VEVDRSGDADADTGRPVDALVGQQRAGQLDGGGEHRLGTAPDVGVGRLGVGEHGQASVGDRDAQRRRPQGDADEP
jgi:hypothetical protein